MRKLFVALVDEMSDGERKIIIDDKVEIGVFRVNDEFYAWRNSCPHQGGPVCQGKLMQGVEERLDQERRSLGIHYRTGTINIICPWHGFEFDVRSGQYAGAAPLRLKRYPIEVRDGEIYVIADN
jgi:nitrite reductase (NADH) small subunit